MVEATFLGLEALCKPLGVRCADGSRGGSRGVSPRFGEGMLEAVRPPARPRPGSTPARRPMMEPRGSRSPPLGPGIRDSAHARRGRLRRQRAGHVCWISWSHVVRCQNIAPPVLPFGVARAARQDEVSVKTYRNDFECATSGAWSAERWRMIHCVMIHNCAQRAKLKQIWRFG
jgi:hypothetical protein